MSLIQKQQFVSQTSAHIDVNGTTGHWKPTDPYDLGVIAASATSAKLVMSWAVNGIKFPKWMLLAACSLAPMFVCSYHKRFTTSGCWMLCCAPVRPLAALLAVPLPPLPLVPLPRLGEGTKSSSEPSSCS